MHSVHHSPLCIQICTNMRLLLINPNTTATMTADIAQAARAAAPAEVEIVATQPGFGPASIEGFFDEAIAAAGVAEQMRLAGPVDAAVIACFGDLARCRAREVCQGPVLGIAEAAFHVASMVATGFSVVTTMTRTCVIAEHLLQKYGLERRCRGVHGTDIPVLALEDGGQACLPQIEDAAREALARDPQRRHRAGLCRHGPAVPDPAAAPGGAGHRRGGRRGAADAQPACAGPGHQQARRLRAAAAQALCRLGRRPGLPDRALNTRAREAPRKADGLPRSAKLCDLP
jgi:allantoin racemase